MVQEHRLGRDEGQSGMLPAGGTLGLPTGEWGKCSRVVGRQIGGNSGARGDGFVSLTELVATAINCRALAANGRQGNGRGIRRAASFG